MSLTYKCQSHGKHVPDILIVANKYICSFFIHSFNHKTGIKQSLFPYKTYLRMQKTENKHVNKHIFTYMK